MIIIPTLQKELLIKYMDQFDVVINFIELALYITLTQALKKTFYLKVFPKITLHIRRLTLWLHSCYDVKKNQPNRDDKKKKCHVSPAQSSTGQSDVNQVNK